MTTAEGAPGGRAAAAPQEQASGLSAAIFTAVAAHDGQVDKNGEAYILHPLRVMLAMAPDDYEGRVVAVLHDVLEDTSVTLGYLGQRFGATIANAVHALTKRQGETYLEYIHRLKADPIARRVKLQDIYDNLDARRLMKLDNATLARLSDKYHRARNALIASPASPSAARPSETPESGAPRGGGGTA